MSKVRKRELTRFGKIVKILLSFGNLSILGMSKSLGISQKVLEGLMNGRSKITNEQLEKFIEVYGAFVPLHFLQELKEDIAKQRKRVSNPSLNIKLRVVGANETHKKFFRFLAKVMVKFAKTEDFYKLHQFSLELMKDKFLSMSDSDDRKAEFSEALATYTNAVGGGSDNEESEEEEGEYGS